ncbi:MAG: hypothetical protein AAGD47_08400 [Pseudomonadota bacterium]
MTIMRVITSFGVAAVLSGGAQAATIVDSFDLNVLDSSGTDTTAILADQEPYLLTVSGTFFIGSTGASPLGDAEFLNVSNAGASLDFVVSDDDIGVGFNGVDIDFGAFRADGIYSAVVIGTGAIANIFYADTFYNDNSGSLQVLIETINGGTTAVVPLPAPVLLLLSGLGGLILLRRRGQG